MNIFTHFRQCLSSIFIILHSIPAACSYFALDCTLHLDCDGLPGKAIVKLQTLL